MPGPSIPHRFFPDPWPAGWHWSVTLDVNWNGYVTMVRTTAKHITSDTPRKVRNSQQVVFQVGPFDEVLELVRESIIASACDAGEQGTLW